MKDSSERPETAVTSVFTYGLNSSQPFSGIYRPK
jgi:hypothetical protein